MVELANHGVAGATTSLNWENNFTSGRFLNGANGLDPFNADNYELFTFSGTNETNPYTTWSQIQAATSAAGWSASDTWSQSFNEYEAGARAAIAGTITDTGSPDAIAAFGWLVANAPGASA